MNSKFIYMYWEYSIGCAPYIPLYEMQNGTLQQVCAGGYYNLKSVRLIPTGSLFVVITFCISIMFIDNLLHILYMIMSDTMNIRFSIL